MHKLLPVLIIVLIIGAGFYFYQHQKKTTLPAPIPLTQGGVCDQETLTCSDGTVLHKTGPNCDFPPCPSTLPASPSASFNAQSVTVTGTMICLPHINTNGPQTLECALGIKADDGNNYALSDPGMKYLIGVGNGKRVEIKGELVKKQDQKYDSAGVITIESLVVK